MRVAELAGVLCDRHPAPPSIHLSIVRRRRIARRRIVAIAATALAAGPGLWLGGALGPGAGGGPLGSSGPLGLQEGYIAVGASVSPFSDAPAVSRLDPALRDAVRQAARDARADGIALRVNSGWRSARYQETLLRRAVTTYGSIEVARHYVKPPAESRHVTGEAVDVGPIDAASWLARHGRDYGLCQTYANELWHYERASTPGGTCPAMATDATAG